MAVAKRETGHLFLYTPKGALPVRNPEKAPLGHPKGSDNRPSFQPRVKSLEERPDDGLGILQQVVKVAH